MVKNEQAEGMPEGRKGQCQEVRGQAWPWAMKLTGHGYWGSHSDSY